MDREIVPRYSIAAVESLVSTDSVFGKYHLKSISTHDSAYIPFTRLDGKTVGKRPIYFQLWSASGFLLLDNPG